MPRKATITLNASMVLSDLSKYATLAEDSGYDAVNAQLSAVDEALTDLWVAVKKAKINGPQVSTNGTESATNESDNKADDKAGDKADDKVDNKAAK